MDLYVTLLKDERPALVVKDGIVQTTIMDNSGKEYTHPYLGYMTKPGKFILHKGVTEEDLKNYCFHSDYPFDIFKSVRKDNLLAEVELTSIASYVFEEMEFFINSSGKNIQDYDFGEPIVVTEKALCKKISDCHKDTDFKFLCYPIKELTISCVTTEESPSDENRLYIRLDNEVCARSLDFKLILKNLPLETLGGSTDPRLQFILNTVSGYIGEHEQDLKVFNDLKQRLKIKLDDILK